MLPSCLIRFSGHRFDRFVIDRCSLSGWVCSYRAQRFVLGEQRPGDAGGTLRAAGRVVHTSRNLFLAEAELFDAEGRPVGRGSGSFMRSTIALGPDVGYA